MTLSIKEKQRRYEIKYQKLMQKQADIKAKIQAEIDYALDNSLPKHWSDCYRNAPDQVDKTYVEQYMTPEEFLQFSRTTKMFESKHYWWPNDVDNLLSVKKDCDTLVRKAYRTKNQVKLYTALPDSFNRAELTKIAMKLRVSSDDEHYVRNSKLFRQTGEWPHNITYHKTPFKPITKPTPSFAKI